MDTKRTKIILLITIGISIALIGVYVYAFQFLRSDIQDNSLLAQDLEQQKNKKENIDITNKMIVDTDKDRIKLATFFVFKDEAITFIETIESLSLDTGVVITIKALDEKEDALSFSLDVSGDFKNMMHLVILLEQLPLNIVIEKVSITRAVDSSLDSEDQIYIWRGSIQASLKSFIN